MTAQDIEILAGLSKGINSLTATINAKIARADLIRDALNGGNYSNFTANNTTAEANYQEPYMRSELSNIDGILPALKSELTTKVKEYSEVKNNIQTASEIKANEAQARAINADADVKIADAKIKLDDAKNKNFAQKNTQYLIIGAVVITFLAIGAMVYKKYFKS